jgi:hypothetical protein
MSLLPLVDVKLYFVFPISRLISLFESLGGKEKRSLYRYVVYIQGFLGSGYTNCQITMYLLGVGFITTNEKYFYSESNFVIN